MSLHQPLLMPMMLMLMIMIIKVKKMIMMELLLCLRDKGWMHIGSSYYGGDLLGLKKEDYCLRTKNLQSLIHEGVSLVAQRVPPN